MTTVINSVDMPTISRIGRFSLRPRRRVGEPQRTRAEVGFQAGVVQLGGGHGEPVHGLAVERQPAHDAVVVDGGDLGRHDRGCADRGHRRASRGG